MLPFILIPLAVAAGAGGLGGTFKGIADLAGAQELTDEAKRQNEENVRRFTDVHSKLQTSLEKLGEQEFKVNANFKYFIESFEKIKNRPEFETPDRDFNVPEFDFAGIKTTSVAAGTFLGAAAGAVSGGVFGAAASAGISSAVMALGTASTGTAIASLSGAAATNAALAALGGGIIGVGGGMALGMFVLQAASLGAGMLIGGVVFAAAGAKVNKKADEIYEAMLANEEAINATVDILIEIRKSAKKLKAAIISVNDNVYVPNVVKLCNVVKEKSDWNLFTEQEKILLENNILAVSILHKLTNTALYKITETDADGNVIDIEPNTKEANEVIDSSLANARKIKSHDK